jgi:hypothetical protein
LNVAKISSMLESCRKEIKGRKTHTFERTFSPAASYREKPML